MNHLQYLLQIDSTYQLFHRTCKYNLHKYLDYFHPINWNDGLQYACEYGYLEIASISINKGAICFNSGLLKTCFNGYIELAQLMINKGATDLNSRLYIACLCGDMKMAQFMISSGATNMTELSTYTFQHSYINDLLLIYKN